MEDNEITRMMNLNVPILSSLIKKIYMAGYRKGKQDSQQTITIDNVEYFDLGLPSGTLWSCAPQYFHYGWHLYLNTYEEAKKLGLPTKEQWEELLLNCDIFNKESKWGLPRLIGPNGQRLGYPLCKNDSVKYTTYTLGENCKKGRNKFWLLSEPDNNHLVDVIVFDKNVLEYDKHFTGYRLPYFLVKKKEFVKY